MSISISSLRRAIRMGYDHRFLCLDVGTSKIGVSIAQSVRTSAEPICVLVRHKSLNPSKERLGARFVQSAQAIHKLVQKYGISVVVIGIPLNHAGEETFQCREIQKFTQALMERSWLVPMPPPAKIILPPLGELVDYVYWNEYGTTKQAVEELMTMGKRKAKAHAQYIDAYAAVEILDSFLDNLRGRRRVHDDDDE
jgi:RNase H-fold protein (predicted Holliday junction resolvase)